MRAIECPACAPAPTASFFGKTDCDNPGRVTGIYP